MSEPFHAGEIEIQERTGERDKAILNGRLIGNSIPPQAKAFLTQQQYCALGWASPERDVWSSFVTGAPGFASTDEAGETLTLEFGAASGSLPAGPPFGQLRRNDHMGLLFIELSTRRRLRVNGTLAELSPTRLRLSVAEAYPNCPKYIQRRAAAAQPSSAGVVAVEHGERLNDDLAAWISGADTFFVASAHPDGPVDSSHRGGKPGFVGLHGDALRVPDYPGNSMFGTLGNFAVNPRAGLAFVDFQNNRQLQLTGDVRLAPEAADSTGETGGTGRWWVFQPRRWIVSTLRPALNWRSIDVSPFNP